MSSAVTERQAGPEPPEAAQDMFSEPPFHQEPLPAYPNPETNIVRFIGRANKTVVRHEAIARRGGWKQQLGAAALALTVTAGAPLTIFKYDQDVLAPMVWGNSTASTYQVAANNYSGPTDGIDRPVTRDWMYKKQPATVSLVIGGMGINDAGPHIARPLVPSLGDNIPNSKVYALMYGSRIFMPGIYDAADAMLAESPADEVILYGMSTGCKTAQYVGAHLRESHPDTHIKAVVCDSGPVDANSTFELRADPSKVTLGEDASRLQLFGGPLIASNVDLFVSEGTRQKYLRPDGSIDWETFKQEVGRIVRDVWTPRAASNELRVGQLALIADGSAPNNIAEIAEPYEGKPSTQFIYIAPTRDRTVDGAYATAAYRDLTAESGLPYKVVPVDSEHAGDNDYADNYNVVINETMRQIDRENELWRQLDGDYTQTIPLRVGGL